MKVNPALSTLSLLLMLILACCNSDDTKPAAQLKANVNGQPFTAKVLVGKFFNTDQLIDVVGHELDSTYNGQYVIGLEVEYANISKPTVYDFAEHDMIGDVIFYFFNSDGKSYYPKEGKLTIKKISTKQLEATFSSLALKSGYADAPPVTLTDGTIRVDLVPAND